jgi:predicted DNA-binding transcriptional regulator YafY
VSDGGARRARQVVRVLGILKILAEVGRPTVYDLAARFRTRRETIYRDLRTLGEVGYPIAGDDAGRLSRPRLAPDLRPVVPPVTLTKRELAALVWAAKRAETQQPFRGALETSLTKLQLLVPRREGGLALALDGSVGGWERGVKDYAGFEPMILRLVEAIISRRRCKVEYCAPGRKAGRRFPYDPYRILSVQGGLYVVGKVPAFANLATLAIDRIRSLELLDDSFTVDPGFDPKRHEAEAFGVVWEKPVTVVLRFRADQAPYVREREWHPTQRFRLLKDGRLEMTFRAGGLFEITRWTLGWGEAVEVLRPARLRREVGWILRGAIRHYPSVAHPRRRRSVAFDRTVTR